jgi:hexosaminidase
LTGFKNWGATVLLEKVYNFDPMPSGLTPDQRRQVLGTEANLWGEYIYNQAKLEYLAFPRLCAMAEVAWSPAETRSLPDFLRRLEPHKSRLDEMNVNYRKSDGSPARPDCKIVNE